MIAEKVFSSLRTVFSNAPVKRMQNWNQKFLTTWICISKKDSKCLALRWCDGNTLIPVNGCLLTSVKDANIIGTIKIFDNRILVGKRHKIA